MTDYEMEAWNAAVARGDQAEIKAMQRKILNDVNHAIMADDDNYGVAGYRVTR